MRCPLVVFFFFFNDTATTEIYTLSLHDALPIYHQQQVNEHAPVVEKGADDDDRSEEHTSELQSLTNLVCRLLLEKKNIPTHTLYVIPTPNLATRRVPQRVAG